MAKGNSGLGSCVIVVGAPGSEFVHRTVRLAHEGELDAVLCDNVYSATAGVARANGRRVLVVGQIQDLAGENGVFFQLALAHAARCCCLLEQSRPVGQEALLAALRAGVTMVGDMREVGRVLAEWLTTAGSGPQVHPVGFGDLSHNSPHVGWDALPAGRHAREAADAGCEDLRATEAELSALLG